MNHFKKFLGTLCLASIFARAPVCAADTCYNRYTGNSVSLVTALESLDVDASYTNRCRIAAVNGVDGYRGTAAQNTALLDLLRQGHLMDPDRTAYYSRYTGNSASLVTALESLDVDASYANRCQIATANGVDGYRGTAAQNTALLDLLRQGRLLKPAPEGQTSSRSCSGLDTIAFIYQGKGTTACKSSSAAMAVNLIVGWNAYDKNDLGGNYCSGLANTYQSRDGNTYTVTYRQDSYEGAFREEKEVIDRALASGLPAVAAVHSTRGGTQHHWVVVVGERGGDYMIADPGYSGSGTLSDNLRTMSSCGYELGLTDYAVTHYGYISFSR